MTCSTADTYTTAAMTLWHDTRHCDMTCDMTHDTVTWHVTPWHDTWHCDMTRDTVTWRVTPWHDAWQCDMTHDTVTWHMTPLHDTWHRDMTHDTWLPRSAAITQWQAHMYKLLMLISHQSSHSHTSRPMKCYVYCRNKVLRSHHKMSQRVQPTLLRKIHLQQDL